MHSAWARVRVVKNSENHGLRGFLPSILNRLGFMAISCKEFIKSYNYTGVMSKITSITSIDYLAFASA